MDIEILGPGCRNCNALEKATAEALARLGIDQTVTKITDYRQIAAYGVMSTPALAIDGQVKTTGRVPNVDELTELIAASNPG